MLIVFIGPQGSGKGTQAQQLTEYGFHHFSMGQALRDRAKVDDEVGNEIASMINVGKLVPARLTQQTAKDTVEQHDKLIFDGFPRTKEQAIGLEKFAEIDHVIHIDVSEEESIRRISNRRVCDATGETFRQGHITEEDRKRCKDAGGEIIQREDDTPEAVKVRLDLYHKETKPLLEHYKEKGVDVIHIDGEDTPENVHKEILRKLDL